MTPLVAAYALWKRELVRFVRQPSRVVSAIASPLLFWALIGSGLSGSFQLPGGPPGVDYLRYYYPGTVVLLVLFAAIFSTISVIDDRQMGFLQGVLVAPVPRWALVVGKVAGGATLAWLQGLLLLLLAPMAGVPLAATGMAAAGLALALVALMLTAVGFSFAWRVGSTQGFHAVMNLVLVPMWLLSGAFFPLSAAAGWLRALSWANPLTYGVSAFRRLLDPAVGRVADPFGGALEPLAVSAALAVLACALAWGVAARPGARG